MIEIKVNVVITPKQIAAVYQEAEFDKSIENEMRLKKMLTETPLTISAWEKEQLIGFVRCLTDFEYFCYISDLVILPEYQGKKIGSRLLAEVQEYLGNRVLMTLRSEETAQGFYQKNGYEKTDAMFRIHRER